MCGGRALVECRAVAAAQPAGQQAGAVVRAAEQQGTPEVAVQAVEAAARAAAQEAIN